METTNAACPATDVWQFTDEAYLIQCALPRGHDGDHRSDARRGVLAFVWAADSGKRLGDEV